MLPSSNLGHSRLRSAVSRSTVTEHNSLCLNVQGARRPSTSVSPSVSRATRGTSATLPRFQCQAFFQGSALPQQQSSTDTGRRGTLTGDGIRCPAASGPAAFAPSAAPTDARPPTMAGVGYVGIPRMKQNVSLLACTSSERPVTGHRGGLACPEILEPSGLGVPGTGRTASLRQVADPTYFFILLKEKHRDLRREIGKFQAQMEVLGREAEQLPAMRRRKSELEKEVEELQEEIVTINSAVTHGRENLRPEALATTAKEMKEKNEEKRALLDELFVSNWSRAEQLSSLQAELHVLTDASEEKLLCLSPEARRTYEGLREKLEQHQGDIKKVRQKIESVSEQLSVAEEKVQSDPARVRLLQLRETREQLRRRQQENLRSMRTGQRQTFPEKRATLLQEIEKVTGEIAELQEKQQRASNLTRSQQEREAEIRKLRLLAAKDAELSAFIERYSEGREKRAVAEAAEEAELSEAEKLSELLEEQLRAVPTPEQAETFTSALKERKTALQKAEQDLLEAKRQLEEKQKELQREGKLGQISEDELRVLSKHLEDMREEIERKLDKTDELRLLIEEERNQLAQSEQRLRSNLEDVQAEAEAATKQKNAIMKRLQANTVHQRLEQLEAELECHRRDVEAVRKAVDMQKQLDPNALTVACMSVVEKIHEKLRARTLKSHWRHHERTAHSVGGTFPKLSRTPAPVRNGNRGGVTAVDVA
uniref:Intraflagellar transport protein component IFT74/72, putative n=1 Tax=Neospora caninum (strain Liverpool) TaxID=572307 RepID=A0A0F7UM07_NEOCL|nr:TPA: intraflagellar transport protein component IFT74/72, putative [Neospora caninum Liverpool]